MERCAALPILLNKHICSSFAVNYNLRASGVRIGNNTKNKINNGYEEPCWDWEHFKEDPNQKDDD
uniref:Uncharacterized protein n=1 Tax=Oryza punctata TaxID=4537 RepID=A0A0E0JEG9_ORYPU